ncbi:MAG TPA: hypothetical protein PKA27_14310 [Fimbriimonadaceae bacterium]|nr:hypothetical protein [Fimbriimonadaceae bacterium]
MPLLQFLATNPETVEAMPLIQVLNICGDGKLKDDSVASTEFRDYLKLVSTERLQQFVNSCLVPGEKLWHALQDIVNEIGRRLELSVTHGRYQGVQNQVGFDGIWTTSTGHSIVIEVKTTDAYRINLDTIEGYRKKLVSSQVIGEVSSILLVVLREDTGDLEAQVRGSRYAWGIRIISAEALMKLLLVKERTEDSTLGQIEQLLIPFEYTRLDRIIDITFAAVQDVEGEQEPELPTDQPDLPVPGPQVQNRSTKTQIDEARNNALQAVQREFGVDLKPRSRAKYEAAVGNFRVVCATSKIYDDGSLWYAYHLKWDAFLADAEESYMVLAAMGMSKIFVLPRSWISDTLSDLWSTPREMASYYHLVLKPEDDKWWLSRRQLPPLDVSPFILSVPIDSASSVTA